MALFLANQPMPTALPPIKQVYEQDHELIDPHTADGVKVAREVREAGETIVCLENRTGRQI